MIAHAVIGGIRLCAARIAYTGADDAGDTPKLGVWSPESAKREGGGLDVLGRVEINRRDGGMGLDHGSLSRC
jgi:hypothetical protein